MRRRSLLSRKIDQDVLISTITIDQNISDPDTMITGDVNGPAIQAIRNNSHIYLCKYLGEKDGEGQMAICQLDDNDSNYYADGTPADLTGAEGDVMMRRARLWTKAVEREQDVWDISFAYGKRPGEEWIEWREDLLGVYKTGYGIMSVSGKLSYEPNYYNGEKYLSEVKKRGVGYSLFKLSQNNIIAFLFMSIYGTTDAQSVVGFGIKEAANTGSLDFLGMSDTKIEEGLSHTKFFGLEDLFSSGFEYLDSYYVSGGVIKYGEFDNIPEFNVPITNGSGWISKILIGDYLNTFPTELEGSSTTGFCDRYVKNPINVPCPTIVSSANTNIDTGGPFYKTFNGLNVSSSNAVSRISFTGNLIEYTDVEAFKALPIIN